MFNFIRKHKTVLTLGILIAAYAVYFSYYTIVRYKTLYASYFDLGIMHQTVFNTYKGLAKFDLSRILEQTNPYGVEQIKRMAIHNDIILALISPLYFIHNGPETLLILQSVVLALGAIVVYKIAKKVFDNKNNSSLLPLVFAFAYLMYPAMQKANMFDFHAVTLSTAFLLFMFYFWLERKYFLSFLFLGLSFISKEQIALTAIFFAIYALLIKLNTKDDLLKKIKRNKYPASILIISVVWFVFSVMVIVPHFRGEGHFALSYYGDFGDTPIRIIIGIIKNPYNILKYIMRQDTLTYFVNLLGPLGFLSLLSPIQLMIALPELAINLFSNSWNMRNIYFHYTSVITPFVFISSIYGAKRMIDYISTKIKRIRPEIITVVFLLATTLLFSYLKGPLPFAKEKEVHPFLYPQKEVTKNPIKLTK